MKKARRILISLLVAMFLLTSFSGLAVLAESEADPFASESLKRVPESLRKIAEQQLENTRAADERVTIIVQLSGKAEKGGWAVGSSSDERPISRQATDHR